MLIKNTKTALFTYFTFGAVYITLIVLLSIFSEQNVLHLISLWIIGLIIILVIIKYKRPLRTTRIKLNHQLKPIEINDDKNKTSEKNTVPDQFVGFRILFSNNQLGGGAE